MSDLVLSGPTLLPDGRIVRSTLQVVQGRIARIRGGHTPAADLVTANTIVPGFIDLQINGAWGADFAVGGCAVADVAARLPGTGVTAFLPTIVSSPLDAYPGLVRAIGEAGLAQGHAHVLGVHFEGPYLSPHRPGAHDPALLRPINLDEIARWADHPILRLVTLAPELPGALDAVRLLRRKGIVVSAGHSNATYAEALAGFDAGITWGTHLFNAMSELRHREPGLPGAFLTSAVPCGLIADRVHVHPAMLRLALHAKGSTGLTLVTDAMSAMGMPPGRYILGSREVTVGAESARLADGTLAGSILTMDQAVRNMMAFAGCSLAQAVVMASTTPARVLGLAHKGRIAPGCDADLVILDERAGVTHTFVAGVLAYEATA